jgi:hypothetical protein
MDMFDTGHGNATLFDMANRQPIYVISDALTGEDLSRHRTRQAALDNWRSLWSGRQIRIHRKPMKGDGVLVAEGIWHERPD